MASAKDTAIRLAAFSFLAEQDRIYGEVVPRGILQQGFYFEGNRIALMGPRGIFKPATMTDTPISITTIYTPEGEERRYEDDITPEGLIRYRYQGEDPHTFDNEWLRRAMYEQVPLIYFFGVIEGQYLPVWPVFVVGDEPAALTFTIAVDDPAKFFEPPGDDPLRDGRRAYVTSLTKQRLHQAGFRKRVITAYRTRCAVCKLGHGELLDAAHILPDLHPQGAPVVPNGLALCKLHHAAFDQNVLGISPDLKINIAEGIREEVDGPMLVHGFQGFHGKTIQVPRASKLKPKKEFLEERYALFLAAG